jgi:uncharacterized protein YwqG
MLSPDQLETQLSAAGLSDLANSAVQCARPGFRIKALAASDDDIAIGSSKIGGMPDVARDFSWPHRDVRPLAFLAQINLSELPDQSLLPKAGLLSFFYDDEQTSWGFDPKDRTAFLVNFLPSVEGLTRAGSPISARKDGLSSRIKDIFGKRQSNFPRFHSLRLSFLHFLSIPDPGNEALNSASSTDEDFDKYAEFFEGYCRLGPLHQLLGLPAPVQNEMELECQLVTNGIYTGDASGYKNPRRPELEKAKSDWILLFQLDSDDDAGMMWGDAGMIYFWIRKQDLAVGRFENAWCILQCH